jgi:hypothetical protein
MTPENYEYGLWSLVLINSVFFILFAASFFKPQSRQDWRTLGMFSAFLVALFTEMYGFPLTIYLLSGWLTERFPGINWLSHDAGHLPEMLFGWKGNPHFGPFHLLSSAFHPGRLLASVLRLASAVPRTARRQAGLQRPIPVGPASSVRCLHSGHDRISIPVADLDHPDAISHSGNHLCPTRQAGRAAGPGGFR